MEMSKSSKKHITLRAAHSDVLTGGAGQAPETFQGPIDPARQQAEHLVELVREYTKYSGFDVPSWHSHEVGHRLWSLTHPRLDGRRLELDPMAFLYADEIRMQEYREARGKALVLRKYGAKVAMPERPVAVKPLIAAILRTEREGARKQWYAAHRFALHSLEGRDESDRVSA